MVKGVLGRPMLRYFGTQFGAEGERDAVGGGDRSHPHHEIVPTRQSWSLCHSKGCRQVYRTVEQVAEWGELAAGDSGVRRSGRSKRDRSSASATSVGLHARRLSPVFVFHRRRLVSWLNLSLDLRPTSFRIQKGHNHSCSPAKLDVNRREYPTLLCSYSPGTKVIDGRNTPERTRFSISASNKSRRPAIPAT